MIAAGNYNISDEDSAGLVAYYGYVKDNSDLWYIMKVDGTVSPITYRYTNTGAVDYTTAWTNRASLTYQNLQDIDI